MLRALLAAAIVLGVLALLFLIFSAVVIVAIAWTHYPYGIPRKRRKRKKEDKA